MNNKNYFIFAAAIALASCSVDEYMGENPEFTQTTKENIIGFGGGTGSMSRATSNTGEVQEKLDNHFIVYGCKSTTEGKYQKVFDNYWVWYDANTASSTSNSDSWEYVSQSEQEIKTYDESEVLHTFTANNAQYIKYWDYSADHYHFVAGSPYDSFTFNTNLTTKEIESANVTGLAGHIDPNSTSTAMTTNPVYIAKPVEINKTSKNYGKAVQFDFVRQQSMVRVGIYETIPGYRISSIKFYKYDTDNKQLSAEGATNENNVVLTSTKEVFYGGTKISATVTYDWTNSSAPSYSYELTGTTAMNNWYGGKFASGIQATSSNDATTANLYGTDKDMDPKGYFTVIPNNNDQAIIIKCDYTLTSEDDSGETINVKGATAAIPAAYCKWAPNTMYTYIFKISQETNGTTGTPGTPGDPGDKPGLFPITFDAAVIAETEAQQGTETIINTPSISTYQDGSVTTNGIEYIPNKDIVVTVNQDGTDQTFSSTEDQKGYIQVYQLTKEYSEAELIASSSLLGSTTVTVTIDTTDNKKASFKPETAGYYAIQYCYDTTKGATYKYKVIKVGNPTAS